MLNAFSRFINSDSSDQNLSLGAAVRSRSDTVSPRGDIADPETMVPQRLEAVGLDPGYLKEALPDTFEHMLRVCGACDEACRCVHDLKASDAGERLAKYCPNAALVDELIVQKGF